MVKFRLRIRFRHSFSMVTVRVSDSGNNYVSEMPSLRYENVRVSIYYVKNALWRLNK